MTDRDRLAGESDVEAALRWVEEAQDRHRSGLPGDVPSALAMAKACLRRAVTLAPAQPPDAHYPAGIGVSNANWPDRPCAVCGEPWPCSTETNKRTGFDPKQYAEATARYEATFGRRGPTLAPNVYGPPAATTPPAPPPDALRAFVKAEEWRLVNPLCGSHQYGPDDEDGPGESGKCIPAMQVIRSLNLILAATTPPAPAEAPLDVEPTGDIYPEGRGCPCCDGTGFVADETIDLLRAKGHKVPWSEYAALAPQAEPVGTTCCCTGIAGVEPCAPARCPVHWRLAPQAEPRP